ncbi:MAG: phosphoglucosamine mutase [Planctomycetota bacterium]
MSQLIISVSGLRGIVGETLTPNVAANYVAAFANHLDDGPVVVTRDGRATGRMLADAIRAALCAVGRDVLDADVAATPTTGRLVRQYKAAGGIQISASHNPPPYNGIKLFGSEGRVVPATIGDQVLKSYQAESFPWKPHDALGSVTELEDTTSDHLNAVLGIVDLEKIRSCSFPVLLDSNHGAGSVLGGKLLAALGCNVTILGDTPNGQFAHTPEPTADNLKGVAAEITKLGAKVGFCQDPDADRLALIDENGRYVGEEYTVAACMDHILQTRKGAVVTNCSTSRMSQDLAEKYGVPFFRSKVGEANVADLMKAENAVFGGEGNGGPIDPQIGYIRDSFVGMAIVLDSMAKTGKPLWSVTLRSWSRWKM